MRGRCMLQAEGRPKAHGRPMEVSRLRTAKARFPDLAVLLITGYSPNGVDVPSEEAVLPKPFSTDSRAVAVQKELAGR